MMRTKASDIDQVERITLSRDGQTMVISIPISLRRSGGRKKVVTPANVTPWSPAMARMDNTIIKALVRAYRWRRILEGGLFGSVRELAKAEKINEAYLGRIVRLTLLSPAITAAILSGQLPHGMELSEFLKPFPLEWQEQENLFLRRDCSSMASTR
jgi:hypothetical protein